MAIYHLSVKPISRSAGRSSTAAAAYRAGCQIADERTGEIHDYTRKRGIESASIVLPVGAAEWARNRDALWNAAEKAEKRKDACVAREVEVALPAELSQAERRRLAVDFAQWMADAEGCAIDVAIHEPSRGGDRRNHHAHLLRSTRKIDVDGLNEKLDTEKSGRDRRADLDKLRERWAELCNERLHQSGIQARIDHRTLEAQGIDREPTVHLGPSVTAIARRGSSSDVRRRVEAEVEQRLGAAREQYEREREAEQTRQAIITLSTDIAAAKAEQKLNDKIAAWESRVQTQIAERQQEEREKLEAKRRTDTKSQALECMAQFEMIKEAIRQQELVKQRQQQIEMERQQQKRREYDNENEGPGF